MILGLLLGCNNGGESAAEKGLSEIIASSKQLFLNAFVSFGDLLLKESFSLSSTTTKKQVGEHLGNVGKAFSEVKSKLESLKGQEQFKLMTNKADEAITKSIKILENIVNGANAIEKATSSASEPIANATGDDNDAVKADETSVKGLVQGINMIYEAATRAGTEPKGNANKQIEDSKEVGDLFNATANVTDAKALKGANKAVIAASGSDILAAIESAKDGTGSPSGNINTAKNAYDIAVAAKNHGNLSNINTNASVIAAGLALKAMAQSGKLATLAAHAPAEGLNALLVGVVGKTVNEIVYTIRRTVDKCLKDVSDCIKEDSSSVVKSSK